MVYNRIIILFIMLCIAPCAYANEIDEFYMQARARFDSLTSLQADINQLNEYSSTHTKLLSVAKMYYKPGNLVLDYTKPNIQKLLVKGNDVLIYDKDSKTVVKTRNHLGISNPLQLVDQYWSKSEKVLITSDSTKIRIRLLPQKDDPLRKIEAVFQVSTKMLNELIYWDKNGNKVKYEFSNTRINHPIPSSKWAFQIPKGVKVLEQ